MLHYCDEDTPPFIRHSIVVPQAPKPPADATSVYLYSACDGEWGNHRLVRATPEDVSHPYTEEIDLNRPDAQQQIDDYFIRFPDAHLVRYGTKYSRTYPPTGPTRFNGICIRDA